MKSTVLIASLLMSAQILPAAECRAVPKGPGLMVACMAACHAGLAACLTAVGAGRLESHRLFGRV